MFGEFDFHLLQVQYLKGAMDQLPAFQPQGLTPAQVQAQYEAGTAVRVDFQAKAATRNLSRGDMLVKQADAHRAATGIYGVMKVRYRKEPRALEAIAKLPTKDQTVAETIIRVEAMSSLWGQLPNDPFTDPPAPFVAWGEMTKAAFDAKLAALKEAQSAFVRADESYEMAQGDLHAKDEELADLATACLAEGRAQFPAGTPEREVLDSIPTEPATQLPAQAALTLAQSPAPGQVHLEYSAAHATSYDVLHKGPGETEFTIAADDVIETAYNAAELPAGEHEYKVIGQNSRGSGEEGEVAGVRVER
jgi:hypothetical protein